jgi:hypothetical protein
VIDINDALPNESLDVSRARISRGSCFSSVGGEVRVRGTVLAVIPLSVRRRS